MKLGASDERPEPMRATYFLSRPSVAAWRYRLFAAMMRNAESPWRTFGWPADRDVELGSRV